MACLDIAPTQSQPRRSTSQHISLKAVELIQPPVLFNEEDDFAPNLDITMHDGEEEVVPLQAQEQNDYMETLLEA